MIVPTPRFGLSCALTTPFGTDGRCDVAKLAAHARSRIAAGCTSVTVFGTTGEGPSLSAATRAAVLGALPGAGLDPARDIVAGVMAPSAGDAIEQVRAARAHGVRRFLLAPPFYFKGVSAEGLGRWFHEAIGAFYGENVEFLLYHIPSVTSVPLPIELVADLAATHGPLVRGVKDSSGDWSYSAKLLGLASKLTILIGDERHLAQAVKLGAEGAISGCANFMPDVLLPLANEGRDDPRVRQVVDLLLRHPVTPAVKAAQAWLQRDPSWLAVAPPLVPIGERDAEAIGRGCATLLRGERVAVSGD